MIREIDDLALRRALDGAVWIVNKALQTFRMPMIATSLPLISVHALLHDCPFSVVGNEEAMEIKIKPILNGRAVDLGNEPARAGQRRCI